MDVIQAPPTHSHSPPPQKQKPQPMTKASSSHHRIIINTPPPPKLQLPLAPHRRATSATPHASKLSTTTIDEFLKTAPLPPNSTAEVWAGRCLNYFVLGHLTDACQGETMCLNCLSYGHVVVFYPHRHHPPKKLSYDALRGTSSLDSFPPRQHPPRIFLHQNSEIKTALDTLSTSFVIDARYFRATSQIPSPYNLTNCLLGKYISTSPSSPLTSTYFVSLLTAMLMSLETSTSFSSIVGT